MTLRNLLAGTDNLSGKFLKDGADILARTLSKIWNLSITYRKVAKLWPIFRKGKKTDPFNYKPISLLLLISKILERVIQDKTNTFLKENNLLYNYQYGFWTNHSINPCLLFLTNKILRGSDEGLLTGMILTDLEKPLGIINHEIRFRKLKAMSFPEGCIAWFQSDLS